MTQYLAFLFLHKIFKLSTHFYNFLNLRISASQYFSHIMLELMSTHSTINFIVMTSIIKPYRKALKSFFYCIICCKQMQKVDTKKIFLESSVTTNQKMLFMHRVSRISIANLAMQRRIGNILPT